MASSKKSPHGDRRMLYVNDPSSMAKNYLPDPVDQKDLRRVINMVADAGVDMYCQEVYSQCWTAYWRSENFFYDQRMQHQRFVPMLDSGTQPVEVLIDESQKRDMPFIVGFRVNDGHGYKGLSKAAGIKVGIEETIKAHPDWELTDLPGEKAGTDGNPVSYYLDFTADGVRDHLVSMIKEFIERFDIDGVELCFRDIAYFPVGKGRQRVELITDILRQIRTALDEKSKAVNKKLVLGARVCSPIEELLDLGLNVKTWVNEELVDYLSPHDLQWVDFNFAFSEFNDLTRNSKCLLYPGLQQYVSQRLRLMTEGRPVDSMTARAFAHSCYQNGADGMSIYNHCGLSRVTPFDPQNFQKFYELRNPEQVASRIRRYIFDSFFAGFNVLFDKNGNQTPITKTDKIFLDRTLQKPSGEYELNLYEDTDSIRTVNMLFRGLNMTHNDELEIRLNGHLIDDEIVRRTRISNAPLDDYAIRREHKGKLWDCTPELGRMDVRQDKNPPDSTRYFPLDPSMLVYGKNSLSVTLTKSDPDASAPIAIEEVEIYVMPK